MEVRRPLRVAALVAAPAAVLATVVLVHVLLTCHGTDVHSGIGVNFFLWPVGTPLLWLLETAAIAGVLAASVRLPVAVLGTVVVLALFTWGYWHLGLNWLSTGLTYCPRGAPGWWPNWLPLY